VDTFKVLQMQDGKLRRVLNVTQEVRAGPPGPLTSHVGCG